MKEKDNIHVRRIIFKLDLEWVDSGQLIFFIIKKIKIISLFKKHEKKSWSFDCLFKLVVFFINLNF
jgi:hypothetical protein